MTKSNQPGSASGKGDFCGEEHWARVDGYRMRYLQCGSGPPLLLVHGLIAYSFSWRFNLAALGACATVYAPDLLGMGYSDRSKRIDCSLTGQAKRLLQFLEQLGIPQADVLGTSHGGAVAMMMAAFGKERVRRLVLVAPVNPWSRYGRRLTRVLGHPAGALLFRAFQSWLPKGYFLRRMYGDPRRIAPGTLRGYATQLDVPGTSAHALRIVRGWHSDLHRLESALPAIDQIPTLLIWGSRDRAVPPDSAPKLAAHLSNARLIIMDGVGHLPYEEVPEEFNRIVITFLAGNHEVADESTTPAGDRISRSPDHPIR